MYMRGSDAQNTAQMPVYLLTAHAYRSWREDHPKGYVQRRQGLKEPAPRLASWRANRANFPEVRFDHPAQELLHKVIIEIATERQLRLHACSTTPTHLHRSEELTSELQSRVDLG